MNIQLVLLGYTLGYHECQYLLLIYYDDGTAYCGCDMWNNKLLKYAHRHTFNWTVIITT